MKVKIRNSKQKGVALAFALMTALLLMTLSTTVVGLSIRHSRAGADTDYAQQALHAADWYANAALTYMQSGTAFSSTSTYGFPNPYVDKTELVRGSKVAPGMDDTTVTVTPVTGGEAQKYGLETGSGNVITFKPTTSTEPLVSFPEGGGSFAICEVAVEKIPANQGPYGTKASTGFYHLSIISRVYDNSMLTAIRELQQNGTVGIDNYPSEGLLATRVIDLKARTEGPMDYLHIIQDGRSWRAQGINLDGRNGLFESFMKTGNRQLLQNGLQNCGFPQGYEENGRLRIDGGTRMANTGSYTDVVIDGSAQFFNSSDNDYARFAGELTQNRSMNTIKANGNGQKNLATVCGGGLNDGADSIGLPQSGENSNYAKDGSYIYKQYSKRDTYQKFSRDMAAKDGSVTNTASFSINGDIGSSSVYVGSESLSKLPKNDDGTGNSVPDVYSPINTFDKNNPNAAVDVRPCFAKIVVELGAGNDSVKIYKENTAAGKKVLLKSYAHASDINNGIITVQGGNVEVRSQKMDGTVGKGNSAKEKDQYGFTGDITIVSDVNADREDSLAYFNDSKGSSCKTGRSIYSDAARKYSNENNDKYPPYKVSELIAAGYGTEYDKCLTKANANAYVWPTPSSEATEREGNIYLTSDIRCASNKDTGKRGSIGIVAKNYISLNDKTVDKKEKSVPTKANPSKFGVEAMLFSFDKSVQFDWTNDAKNSDSNFAKLQSNGDKREFELVGSVVSSNLDIEASVENDRVIGYLNQFEKSNISLDNPPPFTPAYSEGNVRWVIVSYIDRGSRNWF